MSNGAYGADLGPDPRDAALANKAFASNICRLARLKRKLDPQNVLAYACPIPRATFEQNVIILVTGESSAGKDYCAAVWSSTLAAHGNGALKVRTASISDATKREYAAATGADLESLLNDRVYKESHRPALSTFFQEQVANRPSLPEEHFLNVVHHAKDANVLLITGMRDESPVAAFSHLVAERKLIEVQVHATKETRKSRYATISSDEGLNVANGNWRPDFVFNNDTAGTEDAEHFCEDHLYALLNLDIQRLREMVRVVPSFPRSDIEFRDVLGIAQQSGGLELCPSLLQSHFNIDWSEIGAIISCETGGFVFASPLAMRLGVPLALIRGDGKLPPPTVSVAKHASHISSTLSGEAAEKRIEIGAESIPRDASVVVVDDVLASGRTLCATLQLLEKAGVRAEDVTVLIVAEFAVHCGRLFLQQQGFGRTRIQSLLAFGGV